MMDFKKNTQNPKQFLAEELIWQMFDLGTVILAFPSRCQNWHWLKGF